MQLHKTYNGKLNLSTIFPFGLELHLHFSFQLTTIRKVQRRKKVVLRKILGSVAILYNSIELYEIRQKNF